MKHHFKKPTSTKMIRIRSDQSLLDYETEIEETNEKRVVHEKSFQKLTSNDKNEV